MTAKKLRFNLVIPFLTLKYGGKELLTMHGLGHLDFGPRHLYPALSLFTQPDIKSEDYPGMSRKGGFVGGMG